MAIYRTIQLNFWDDTKVLEDFTPEDRYFYLYLLTNTHTNLIGCYEIAKTHMSRELGYTVEVIERLLDRFENVHNVIFYDRKTKEMLIKNWSKYNWSKSPKVLKAVVEEFKYIKSDYAKEFLSKVLKRYGIDTVSIEYEYSMDTSVYVSVTDTVTDSDYVNKEEDKKVKHKYGEYQNVLLTDEELEKLKSEYADYENKIEALSNYIASKGAKYKSHYATIRNWARNEKKTVQQKADKWNGKENQRDIDFDDYEKMILAN